MVLEHVINNILLLNTLLHVMGSSHHPVFLSTTQLNISAKAQILGTVKKILSDPNLFVKWEKIDFRSSTSGLKVEHLPNS